MQMFDAQQYASYFFHQLNSANHPFSMHRILIDSETGLISLLHLLEQMIQTNSEIFSFDLWLLHTASMVHLIHINFDSDPSYISVIKPCFFSLSLVFSIFWYWFDSDSDFMIQLKCIFRNWCRCNRLLFVRINRPVFVDSLPDLY